MTGAIRQPDGSFMFLLYGEHEKAWGSYRIWVSSFPVR